MLSLLTKKQLIIHDKLTELGFYLFDVKYRTIYKHDTIKIDDITVTRIGMVFTIGKFLKNTYSSRSLNFDEFLDTHKDKFRKQRILNIKNKIYGK